MVRQLRRPVGTAGPNFGGGRVLGAGGLKGRPIGVVRLGGRPDLRKGPGHSRPIENTGFLDRFKMGRERLDKKRPVGPEVRARELSRGDIVERDGRRHWVVDLTDQGVFLARLVGDGTRKGAKQLKVALDNTVPFFPSAQSLRKHLR